MWGGGKLGNLLAVRATIGEYLPNWHPYEDYRQMYASRADLGGGVILSQIHEFDYLYSLFGVPRRVYALGGQWSDLRDQRRGHSEYPDGVQRGPAGRLQSISTRTIYNRRQAGNAK